MSNGPFCTIESSRFPSKGHKKIVLSRKHLKNITVNSDFDSRIQIGSSRKGLVIERAQEEKHFLPLLVNQFSNFNAEKNLSGI